MSPHELGYVVGRLALPVLFVIGGYYVARRMNRTRPPNEQVKWPIITGWVLMGLAVLSFLSQAGNRAAQSRSSAIEQAAHG